MYKPVTFYFIDDVEAGRKCDMLQVSFMLPDQLHSAINF